MICTIIRIGLKPILFRLCIALFTFVLGIVAFLAWGQIASSGHSNELNLRLVLNAAVLRVDESPGVKLYVTNNSNQTVTLVQPGDGSVRGWRTPIVHWSITQLDSTETIDPRMGFVCGNIEALRWNEVFTLSPGETKDMTTWLPGFRKPGTYRVSLSYENQPSREWRGIELGTHHPIAMWRVKHSTECSLTSNEVLVTVIE